MRVVILRELYLCLFVQMTVSQIKYHCLSEENGCGYLGNHQRISAKSSPALWLSDSEPLRLSYDSSPDQLRSANSMQTENWIWNVCRTMAHSGPLALLTNQVQYVC